MRQKIISVDRQRVGNYIIKQACLIIVYSLNIPRARCIASLVVLTVLERLELGIFSRISQCVVYAPGHVESESLVKRPKNCHFCRLSQMTLE